jgi:hypothetical protein
MTPEIRRIHELVGALSEAFWHEMDRREGEPGFSSFAYLIEHYEGEARAQTDEETAIWDELTSPGNYDVLVSYLHYWTHVGVNEYAARLHRRLLAESRRRRDRKTGHS